MTETDEPASRADATEVGADDSREAAGLDDLPDGIGCAEIWDHLSDRRRRNGNGNGE